MSDLLAYAWAGFVFLMVLGFLGFLRALGEMAREKLD